jgi:hypothetical protein
MGRAIWRKGVAEVEAAVMFIIYEGLLVVVTSQRRGGGKSQLQCEKERVRLEGIESQLHRPGTPSAARNVARASCRAPRVVDDGVAHLWMFDDAAGCGLRRCD